MSSRDSEGTARWSIGGGISRCRNGSEAEERDARLELREAKGRRGAGGCWGASEDVVGRVGCGNCFKDFSATVVYDEASIASGGHSSFIVTRTKHPY